MFSEPFPLRYHLIARLLVFSLGLACLFPSSAGAADSPTNAKPLELRSKSGGRVWVYLPQGMPTGAKLGCVLVPPAGTPLFHGMALGEGDRPEHIPYVSAGFAVIAFDISGALPEKGSSAALPKALKGFADAKCGIDDALNALALALDKFPQIDPKRVFVAGHSSAGTLALQIAAASDQFQGCIAYAPVTDVEAHIGAGTIKTLDRLSPGVAKLFHDLSPINQAGAIRCPVFLFHADDDSIVSTASLVTFRDALAAAHKSAEYVSVKEGGHYDSMIDQGIPKAIAWLKEKSQKQQK